jgi:hypothetical protein
MNNVQVETTRPQDRRASVPLGDLSDQDLAAWADLTHELLVAADMAYLMATNERARLFVQLQEAQAEIHRRQH